MAARTEILESFGAATRQWFRAAFTAPTAAQAGAWRAISRGAHTLVIAPTGSGKTLAAFLWAVDRLASTPRPPKPGVRVLYVSPLKALAVDVERNLSAPLVGIGNAAASLGLPAPSVTVGVRSGDTPAAVRRTLVTSPPDILITTPESLYLMLTSSARETLTGVETVIVDEVHAMAPTKRGTHLALSLERLDALTERPVQRIGLSATVRPPETVARFLTGAAGECEIVKPPAAKTFDLQVDVPVPDMTDLPLPPNDSELDDAFSPTAGSLWPFIEESIVDRIEANRATIVFANSRRLAERLTARLNEIAAERAGEAPEPVRANTQVPGGAPSYVGDGLHARGVAPILARAHHGSVSKEQRADIENDLKSGRLRCVVATSSLELGIDMGAVDLVIQVEAPPSVASGLQRIGRAGHQVGEISQGVLYPKHRTDLLHCAVVTERMRSGQIEAITVPANPLDILAQQTIAATAVDDLNVDEWFATVRRSAPYADLTRDVFDAVLDLISGRYPSDEFAGLAARVDYDRATGTLHARRGTLRIAVTSGGTIPDRGMFGVFLVGDADTPSSNGRGSRRVGELDEEMVYESRVGDVFALGASSWRIAEITPDRVLVTPAPGQPGRLPFWIGDATGRPAELGVAIGKFVAAVNDDEKLAARAADIGLTDFATGNLAGLLAAQRDATEVLPTDRTLVVERFRDELGDWRLVLHSPYGLRVHAPWASAIATQLSERLGLDGATTAADDGIIVRLPDTDDAPPGSEIFLIDPDDLERIVTGALAGSSMFAARFRECAARALLLPRRDPGRRAPLWQQRQRSAQLLGVAAQFPDFPIILETVRECLDDVYDLPSLHDLLTRITARRVRLVDVETVAPSPFAASMLLGYTGAFMYDDDAPVAERRAAALSLDTALLAQLLGRVDLRELLDPVVIADVVARLQRTAPERRARDGQDVADLLRWLGPLTDGEIGERYAGDDDLDVLLAELVRNGRVVEIVAGDAKYAAIEDVARLRDGLGVPPPLGVPDAYLESPADPVGDLVHRFARTHGPFRADDAASALGMAVAVVRDTLVRLAEKRVVVEGQFVPDEAAPDPATHGPVSTSQWCHSDVLGQLRRGSLAAGRAEVEPVTHEAYARFLLSWQHVTPAGRLRGVFGVASVIEQLAGQPIPASAWESLVLPQRVADYRPSMLDELLSSGEVTWSGHGRIGNADGWIAFHPTESAPLTLRPPDEFDRTDLHDRIARALDSAGALRFTQLVADLGEPAPEQSHVETTLWDLVWAGAVSNDSFSVVRALLRPGRSRSGQGAATPSHRVRGRAPRLRSARLSSHYLAGADGRAPTSPTVAGRWFALSRTEIDATTAAAAACEVLLDRYGVVTKGSVTTEEMPGGFARVYKALSVFEDSGQVRRGYYIDGLGGAQFAPGHTVDVLRDASLVPRETAHEALVLAATDPASPYGAALGWPSPARRTVDLDARTDTAQPESGGHRPGRKPGALVVLVEGRATVFVERGGKRLLTFTDDETDLESAAAALTEAVRGGRMPRIHVDQVDGRPVLGSDFGALLVAQGFSTTPRGLRMNYDPRHA
ncbi:MAG: ATP-dependent helicase [Gordonia sp. (in: high G+C Gram-positive bacteria)]